MDRPHALASALGIIGLLVVPAASPALTPSASKGKNAPCGRVHTSSYHQQRHCSGRPEQFHGKPSHELFFTAHDGHCPDATLAPSATDVARVRAATLCLVNRERTSRGERALQWNNRLIASAQAHTESMAFSHYFAHVGPGGQTPLARMRATGYISSARVGVEVGENIGWGSLWLGTPRAIVAAWMASPGHRANILDRHFRETGIGVSPHTGPLAHGQSGGIYTQDFGVIIG